MPDFEQENSDASKRRKLPARIHVLLSALQKNGTESGQMSLLSEKNRVSENLSQPPTTIIFSPDNPLKICSFTKSLMNDYPNFDQIRQHEDKNTFKRKIIGVKLGE